MIDCRNCETPFSLDDCWYYDNLCPRCKADEDEEATWPACCKCGDRYEPGSGTVATVVNPGVRGGRERVGVCSPRCKSKIARARP